jgi:flagellar protein FliO/FliZ
MLELTVRLIASLAIVVGLLLLIAKVGGRRMRGRSGSLVQVVHRQPLSRSSAVAVVTVGSRVLVLGTTEQQVSVLTELDADELDDLDALPEPGADLVLVPGDADENGDVTEIPVLVPTTPVTEAPAVPARRAGARRASTGRGGARAARSGGARRAEVGTKATTRTSKTTAKTGARRAAPAHVPSNGPLAGSVLSPDTWKQALAAAMGKAS